MRRNSTGVQAEVAEDLEQRDSDSSAGQGLRDGTIHLGSEEGACEGGGCLALLANTLTSRAAQSAQRSPASIAMEYDERNPSLLTGT